MKKRKTIPALSGAASLIVIVIIITIQCLPDGFQLTVLPKDGGPPLIAVPIQPGECFTLHYFHSVNGCPIWEKHRIDNQGVIHIQEERFVAFAAGMGHWPGHGHLTRRGEHQVIENINKPIGSFILRVADEQQKHTIIWRGKSLNLSKMAAGQAVIISTNSTSALKRLWRNFR
jgi:hypothetical protein